MGAWIPWHSLAVLFFCVWSIVHAQSSSDQLLNRDACLHPYLPSTIGRLSDAQEVHLHSIYRVNFTRENEVWCAVWCAHLDQVMSVSDCPYSLRMSSV